VNEFGQPIGEPLGDWTPPPEPSVAHLVGESVRLEALSPTSHARDLWRAFEPAPASLWTYMSFGPFVDRASFESTLTDIAANPGLRPYVLTVDAVAAGFACFLRIEPGQGVLEIGSIAFAPVLQRTTAATEGLYLMVDHAFQLGYRRAEWKCDDLNAPSRRAADRLGFRYEGTFRKATHYKGRSRDTAWYALTDDDWMSEKAVFETWLADDNFDASGRQIRTLAEVRADLGAPDDRSTAD
jgi:RimJ/RimL family protein N-acetyltransferase